MTKLEIIKHKFQGLSLEKRAEKLQLVNLLAIAIYADHVAKEEEIEYAQKIIGAVFEDDYAFLVDELKIALSTFNQNLQAYERKKEELVVFIIKNERVDLAKILVEVFESDNKITRGEQKLMDQLWNLIKG
jgi:uncharacterized tellurite resistance protein B-like protein